MMKSLISVIVPVYGSENNLNDCINSILNQTLMKLSLPNYDSPIQIILVGDGSSNKISEIAQRFAKNHDNIKYVLNEKSNAVYSKNLGVEHANGEYLSFINPTDLILDNAFERMISIAQENKSDLISGFACEFTYYICKNSKNCELAFNEFNNYETISNNHNLFYDSSINNKLIKRSFWIENNFKFSEDTYCDDFAVVIPVMLNANNISMVHEPCYLSRITDFEMENIKNTLSSIRIVDTYLTNNPQYAEFRNSIELKWLKTDLMDYINYSITCDNCTNVLKSIKEFVENSLNLDNINFLNEFDNLKYELLLNSNFEKLKELLKYLEYDLNNQEINQNSILNANDEIFNKSSYSISQVINEGEIAQSITKISFKNQKIEIEGFAFIPGLDNNKFDDRHYSFYLYNCKSHKKLELASDDIKIKDFPVIRMKYGKNGSYNSSGYKIHLNLKEICSNEFIDGENRILMRYEQNDIKRNYFISFLRKEDELSKEGHAGRSKEKYFLVKYDYNNNLIIDISSKEYLNEKISVENNELCIFSQKSLGKLYLDYSQNGMNVPLDYDSKKGCYHINITKIPETKGKLVNENGDFIIHQKKQLTYFTSNSGQCIINTLDDYVIKISKEKTISILSSISKNNSKINMEINLKSTNNINKLQSSILYFKNDLNTDINTLAIGEVKSNEKIKFTMDLADYDTTKNLIKGIHEIHAQYIIDGEKITTSIYISSPIKIEHIEDYSKYLIFNKSDKLLKIKTTSKWPFYENTFQKRNFISNTIYSLFRVLPINKKQIMFESMWGKKYSCNPRYFYEYIDKNYPDWKCIWSLNDEHVPIQGNGIKVRRKSLKYYYYLATSKYFVNNGTFFHKFIKRNKQKQIQTTHGMYYKTAGMDIDGVYETEESKQEYMKNTSLWDYMTIQSQFFIKIMNSAFGYFNEFMKFGFPRTDILYTKNNTKDIEKIKNKLNIPLDKKIILYAPTWRVVDDFELKLDLKSFEESLSDEYILILRLHHVTVTNWNKLENRFIYDLSKYESVEELYLISDILITDYSSTMFDFSLLNRPIILFAYDLDEYENTRKSYYNLKENTPGPIFYTSKDVENAILNIEETEKECEKYRDDFKNKFLGYECENSCEKIFNELTKD